MSANIGNSPHSKKCLSPSKLQDDKEFSFVLPHLANMAKPKALDEVKLPNMHI